MRFLRPWGAQSSPKRFKYTTAIDLGGRKLHVSIRPMRFEDLPRVLHIERQNFGSDAWSEDAFRGELKNDKARYYVLEVLNTGVIGYIGGWLVLDELHITNLSISSSYQGKGLGKLLLSAFISICRLEKPELRYALLEVSTVNYRAIKLYYSLGFKVLGLRKSYYKSGEDAYVMALNLSNWSYELQGVEEI